MKSKVCVVGGGRTLWANFYNACFLLFYLFFAKPMINLIPYSALAAILIYTGWRMCEPAIWRHVGRIGSEQLFLFGSTVVVTLCTDLLWGIAAGMLLKLLLNLSLTSWHLLGTPFRPTEIPGMARHVFTRVGQFFLNPVSSRADSEGRSVVHFNRPLVCFNTPHLHRELGRIPADARDVELHIGPGVSMVDHTTVENLFHFVEEFRSSGRGRIEVFGLDRMLRRSEAETCVRLAPPPVAYEEEGSTPETEPAPAFNEATG